MCTEFMIKSEDGHVVVSRSMEFNRDIKPCEVVIFPAKLEFQSPTPNHVKDPHSLAWTNKYRFAGISTNGQHFRIADGMNDRGLSIGGLYFKPYCGYQHEKHSEQRNDWLANEMVGTWILGSFATVKEVQEELPAIPVFGEENPYLNEVIPVHLGVHDREGNYIVIEYIKGHLHIHENPVGVMTNSPPFDWQLINLDNFVNLHCRNAEMIHLGKRELDPTGQGSGMLGLPGDYTPPSRFVRTAFLLHSAKGITGSEDAVNLAQHLLNNVDIARGTIRDSSEYDEQDEYTWWAVIKDLHDCRLYFRTYENMTLRLVDLNHKRFSHEKHIHVIPIDVDIPCCVDVTKNAKAVQL